MNQEIEQYLQLFVSHRQDDWPEWIAVVEFSYNNKIHMAMQVSPFFANYGYHPRTGTESHWHTKMEAADDFATQMKHIHKEVQSALVKAKEEMKHYADYHRGEPLKYQVGNKVWLETKHLKLTQPSKKLSEKQIGPYPIVEMKSSNAVQLKLPRTIKIHPVINVSHVWPYKPSHIPQQSAPEPPPIKIKGEFKYEVEQILDLQLYWGNLQYLVKWLGYTEEHNMWEPLSNLTNADKAVKDFHKRYPAAPRRIQTLSLFQFWPIVNHTDIPVGVTSKLNLEEQTFREMRILKRE